MKQNSLQKVLKSKTAKIYKCSCQSLTIWVKQFKHNGLVLRKKRVKLSYKITKNHVLVI